MEEYIFKKEQFELLRQAVNNINVMGEQNVINLATVMQVLMNCEVITKEVGDE